MKHNTIRRYFTVVFYGGQFHIGRCLVTLLFLLTSISVFYAQTYQQVGFQFADQPSSWDINTSTTGLIPSGNILATSSNGYGTWIATDASANWFLLFPPSVVDFFEDTNMTTDECLQLRDRVDVYLHTFKNRKAYDSSRYFLEHCFTIDNAWQDFQKATYSCDALSQEFNQHHWPDYVEWLESVLYLREDSIWYCSDVSAIAMAMTHVDSTKDRDYRAAISVLKYLIDSVDCGFLNIHIKNAYNAAIESQLYIWRDSVQDSLSTPPDTTTFFTLDELGLTSLRGHHSDVSESDIVGAGLIADLIAAPNPTKNESHLHITLSDAAMLKLEVFDALGKRVMTQALGWQGAGTYTHAVDMSHWPSGAYYARVSSLRGEVKTIMLGKEH